LKSSENGFHLIKKCLGLITDEIEQRSDEILRLAAARAHEYPIARLLLD